MKKQPVKINKRVDIISSIACYKIIEATNTKKRILKMKTKYANLIEQFERVTDAYNTAARAVKDFIKIAGDQPDTLGVSRGFTFLSGNSEKRHTIQLSVSKFAEVAPDCGSDFTKKYWDEFTRFECTLFGYRVFCLVVKGTVEEVFLINLLTAEEKSNG